MTKTSETLDLTPTWESLVPVLLYLSRQGIADVEQELVRMAQAADKWNAHCKENK
jgi:hypothetical protein